MTAHEIPIDGAAEQVAPETEEPIEAEETLEQEVEVDEPEDEEPEDDESDDDESEDEDDDSDDDDDDSAVAEELAAAKAEAAQMKDRYARLQAEWDNYRKRTAAERESERARAAEKLVTDLLPALDDIERALNHAKESGDGSGLVEGVEAIQTKFLQILEKHKVVVVPAMGEPFDAMKHQAVGTQEDESVPEETVVQVYQQGYQMGDRVIRPSMVVTSTGGPAREAAAEE